MKNNGGGFLKHGKMMIMLNTNRYTKYTTLHHFVSCLFLTFLRFCPVAVCDIDILICFG